MSIQYNNSKLRGIFFNALIGILLLSFSICSSLIVAEVLLRTFHISVTPSEYSQRYLIDGYPSSETGYFTGDPVLPFALEANYNHTVVDLAWHPKPFTVSTDAYGYRNSYSDNQTPSVVFVGDSAIFGFGVEEEETIPAQLGLLMHKDVYNLAIPGAGPECYMVMLERYLNSSQSPQLIIVGFFAGNDYNNLEQATWKEITKCKPPISKIYRSDAPLEMPVYPIWLTTSFLKSSHLAKLLFEFAIQSEPLAPWELVHIQKLSSDRAIRTLKIINPSPQDINSSINMSLKYATELEQSSNLTMAERDLLESYKVKMHEKNWKKAYPIADEISQSLISRDYNPISKNESINLASQFNFYSGYYWQMIDEDASGYISDYDHLLDALKDNPSFQEFTPAFQDIQIKLRAKDASVEADINKINKQLEQRFSNPFIANPVECDKLNLFLVRLQTLATMHNSNLMIIIIPHELQIKLPSSSNCLYNLTSKHHINCLDLNPNLIKHYEENNSALYLDKAHFNKQGNKLVAKWTYKWLNSSGYLDNISGI